MHIWTDTSGHFGCGALNPCTRAWLQLPWPQSYRRGWLKLKEESITLKELLPIVLASAVWGRRWRRRTVLVHCDNLGTVALVNSGYSRIPQIMHLTRCLFFIRAHFEMDVVAQHIPGAENTLADTISRNNLSLLFSQVPDSTTSQTQIPPNLLSLLVEDQPDWTSPAWARLFGSCFPQESPLPPGKIMRQESTGSSSSVSN